jgi:hypothetical protein
MVSEWRLSGQRSIVSIMQRRNWLARKKVVDAQAVSHRLQETKLTDQQVVLVIGGASGIGADSARAMAEAGYAVAVMSSSGKGEALGRELGGLGFTGSNLVPDDLEAFVQLSVERFGRIDGVLQDVSLRVLNSGAPQKCLIIGPVLSIVRLCCERMNDHHRRTRSDQPCFQNCGRGTVKKLIPDLILRPEIASECLV